MNKFVRFISSMKLAVFSIILLIILSIIGSVIPQGRELIFYTETYGNVNGNLIFFLHFHNFFRSAVFLLTCTLFFTNLAACTVLRIFRRFKNKKALKIGPDIIHISLLILIILSLFVMFTRKDTVIMIGIGDNFTLPGGTDVKLVSFDIEYYDNGRPKDWISRILVNSAEPEEFSIEVNKPVKIGNYSIYQNSYNLAPVAIITENEEKKKITNQHVIQTQDGYLYLVEAKKNSDKISALFNFSDAKSNKTEQLVLETGDEYKGITIDEIFILKESGLQIVYQPGNMLIIASLFLFCIGLFITFYQKIGDII
jgi:cytochrome c biogenesis protein ResB